MNAQGSNSKPDRPQVAVGVVVIDGTRVLLVKRANPPRQGQWSIPGGRQHLGEKLADTARREVLEETGLTIAPTGLLDVIDGIFKSPDGVIEQHYTLVDFAARPIGGSLQAGDDAADAKWVERADLVDMDLWSETRRIIDMAFARGTSDPV
jgi:ADP-ribose pyrophosphatase YjhB (NUDIX family)